MEMLILRRRGAGGLEGAHVPVGTGSEVEAVFQDLPPSEVRGLQRDDNVLGAAEPMPLMLIEPVSSPGHVTAAPADAEVAWGVKAVGASTSPFTGKGVTVAVLDTGIDKATRRSRGWRSSAGTSRPGTPDDFNDTNSHGTHCAGTIFGRAVNGTRIGVAPGVTRAVIGKVLGPGGGSTGTLFTAINWAIENKAQIISMSLGMDLVGFRDRLAGARDAPEAGDLDGHAGADRQREVLRQVRQPAPLGHGVRPQRA